MSNPLAIVQDALCKASEVPSYKSAQILSDPYAKRVQVLLISNLSDLTRNNKRSICTHVSFATTHLGGVEEGSKVQYSFEEKDEVVMSAAHDIKQDFNGHRIVFRSCEGDNGSKEKRLFVEWWSGVAMLQSVEVTKHHGAFNADSTFGRISFHPSRPWQIAYIAEAKAPEVEKHTKNEYKDDWGEKLEGKSSPVIIILDFETQGRGDGERFSTIAGREYEKTDGRVMVITGPRNTALAEVVLGPGNDEVTFVATETTPRRYGLAVCFNRRSAIYQSNFDGSEMRCLTNGFEHARSPYWGGDGYLYFLSNPSAGPHWQCSEIQRQDVDDGTREAIVPISTSRSKRLHKFAGVYTDRLVYKHGSSVYFNTQVENIMRAYRACTEDNGLGNIDDLVPDDIDSSWSIIGAGKEQLVLAKHDSNGEVELRHYRLDDHRTNTFLHRPTPFKDAITTTIISEPDKPYVGSIFLAPKQANNKLFSSRNGRPPLIVVPHGGPHSAYSTTYSAYHAALVLLGATILRVNYTGSTGFGSDSIHRLIGRIGTEDVEDVHYAVTALKNSGAIFDADRVCVMGGSHGGFIGAWLLGRYPDAYKCGIFLNPVINLGTVGAGSDIPDWAVSEGISPPDDKTKSYNLAHPPLLTADTYDKLWKASPMSVADKVTSPVCMILGGKDRRVPNYEGRNYVHYLQGRGLKHVICYMFPEDGHSLDSGDAYRGVFEAVGMFLKDHL